MADLSLGDMAQSFILRRQTLAARADLQRAATETVTGKAADPGARLSGDFVPLAGIDASLARLTGYGSVTTEAGLMSAGMQTALSVLETLSSDMGATLLTASSGANAPRVNAVAVEATSRFGAAISALNTRVGDRALFAGAATMGPAVAAPEAILQALETAIGGATTASDIEVAVQGWFANSAGYDATAYLGGAPFAALSVAAGETVALDITARDPALRDMLAGLAMAAMLDRGALHGQPEARADLARRAGEALMSSQTGQAHLAARLGSSEARIEEARVRNEAEAAALQIARVGLLAVDSYEAATRLQLAETQIETLYTLTARLSRLNLVDYL